MCRRRLQTGGMPKIGGPAGGTGWVTHPALVHPAGAGRRESLPEGVEDVSLDLDRRELLAAGYAVAIMSGIRFSAAATARDVPLCRISSQRRPCPRRPPVPLGAVGRSAVGLCLAGHGSLPSNVPVFRKILAACAGLNAQLVLALGKWINKDDEKDGTSVREQLGPIPGNPLVVDFAPQCPSDRASLLITHAGVNTVVEAVSRGVPMIALPRCDDHPGMGGGSNLRAWVCGRPSGFTSRRATGAVERVLTEPAFRQRACSSSRRCWPPAAHSGRPRSPKRRWDALPGPATHINGRDVAMILRHSLPTLVTAVGRSTAARHIAKQCDQVGREPLAVAQWRGGHPLPHSGAECRQSRPVSARGPWRVRVVLAAGAVASGRCSRDSSCVPAGKRLARHTSSPARPSIALAGGQRPGEWERIQGHVDPTLARQIVGRESSARESRTARPATAGRKQPR